MTRSSSLISRMTPNKTMLTLSLLKVNTSVDLALVMLMLVPIMSDFCFLLALVATSGSACLARFLLRLELEADEVGPVDC